MRVSKRSNTGPHSMSNCTVGFFFDTYYEVELYDFIDIRKKSESGVIN